MGGGGDFLTVRLRERVTVELNASDAAIRFGDAQIHTVVLDDSARQLLRDLEKGIAWSSVEDSLRDYTAEAAGILNRLRARGLLEFVLRGSSGLPLLQICPHTAQFAASMQQVEPHQFVVLSRFCYFRRDGDAILIESPLSEGQFVSCDARLGELLFRLQAPARLDTLASTALGFENARRVVGVLAASQIVIVGDESCVDTQLRLQDGDPDLAPWDFHDLLFHCRSRAGRHGYSSGGTFDLAGLTSPLPVLRGPHHGDVIHLDVPGGPDSELERLVETRTSSRVHTNDSPITAAELSRFLYKCARVRSIEEHPDGSAGEGQPSFSSRPYPSGGASYELELYLCVGRCTGLAGGLYHYRPEQHALVELRAPIACLEAVLRHSRYAMGVESSPNVVILVAARFGRVSWKYRSIAYAVTLKNVGALYQTFYLAATSMGLAGCALGNGDIANFESATGLKFYAEGLIGEFALGRGMEQPP